MARARSIRKFTRYSCGVTPVSFLKSFLTCGNFQPRERLFDQGEQNLAPRGVTAFDKRRYNGDFAANATYSVAISNVTRAVFLRRDNTQISVCRPREFLRVTGINYTVNIRIMPLYIRFVYM